MGFDDPAYQKLKEEILGKQNGTASTSNGVPARQQPQLTPEQALHDWRYHVGLLIKAALDAVPEKDREQVAGFKTEILIDSVVKEAKEMLAGHEKPLWPLPPDLSDSDAEEELDKLANRAIEVYRSAYLPEAPVTSDGDFQLPDILIRKKIEVFTWSQMRVRRNALPRRTIVDGWLFGRELSHWAGKVEHGKTTLMRELFMCVIRGEPFLGRHTIRGKVFYAMLDADGEDLTFDEFAKLGFGDDPEDEERSRFIFEPNLAAMEKGPEQFFRALWDWQPDLVIIDPFARLKTIGDFNDYNNTYLMGMISEYAKRIDAHFCLPGHIPRGRPAGAEAASAAFGSIAFSAGVNARFVVERKQHTDIHVLRTSKGKSAGFQPLEGEHVLERNDATGRIMLGNPFSFGDQARALKGPVRDFLMNSPLQEYSPAEIAASIGGLPGAIRAACQMLFDDEAGVEHRTIDRSGKGKKGSPYKFSRLPDTAHGV